MCGPISVTRFISAHRPKPTHQPGLLTTSRPSCVPPPAGPFPRTDHAMIVYRDQRFRAESRPLLDQIHSGLERLDFRTSGTHDGVVDSLISAGMLESAVADAIFTEVDGLHP